MPYLVQVHLARLNGERVVVKVQRPGLKSLFDIDLKNIRVLAQVPQPLASGPAHNGTDSCGLQVPSASLAAQSSCWEILQGQAAILALHAPCSQMFLMLIFQSCSQPMNMYDFVLINVSVTLGSSKTAAYSKANATI